MSTIHENIVRSMKLIQDDCKTDATTVDTMPFTGMSVGTNFGNLYAMVASIAKAVEILAREQT